MPENPTSAAWNFMTAGRLCFGRGAVEQITDLLSGMGFHKAFVLADQTLEHIGHVRRVRNALTAVEGMEVAVCLHGGAEPSIDDALKCVQAAQQAEPDLIVGLGGGSNIDLAKVTATVIAHGGSPKDYFGFNRIPGPIISVMAVPTTAGTGSEVSHSAVLTDGQADVKVSTLSRFLRPSLAIVDPSLTDTCPRQVTADSGIDALVHAVEAFTARRFTEMQAAPAEARAYEGAHPLGKLLASEAIRLVGRSLQRVVSQPDSKPDRDNMALAATYAGMAFSNCGVALVHGLEYPIGAMVHCSHGAGNGTLLPYVMRFNLPERTAEIAEIGRMLGCVDAEADATDLRQAERTIDWIVDLRRQIGIPDRLREYGLTVDALPSIASRTSEIERLMTLNPRQADVDDLLQILRDAW
ncbi:MAG: iron-containing alcohol dehydrogenase [Pirellulaceae bacterium]